MGQVYNEGWRISNSYLVLFTVGYLRLGLVWSLGWKEANCAATQFFYILHVVLWVRILQHILMTFSNNAT